MKFDVSKQQLYRVKREGQRDSDRGPDEVNCIHSRKMPGHHQMQFKWYFYSMDMGPKEDTEILNP